MNITPVYLIDTTLRDGEQSPGVAFSRREKMKIAELLHRLRVDEVEAGCPAIGYDEQMAIKSIANAGFSFRTSCWCRAKATDILQAAKLNTQSINISLPVSDVQIQTFSKSREWVLMEAKNMVSLAKQYFPHVTLGAQDATRADRAFLNEFVFYATDFGADRLRIADTTGIADPFGVIELFSSLTAAFPKAKFEFHGHNDLGMATANTIAALKSGAACVSATVNGIGERAGNAALEEIIAWLFVKAGEKKYNTKTINRLSQCVAALSGIPTAHNKSITGKNAYRHESGIHTAALLRNVESYQALDPADYGIEPYSITFGKHSGKSALIHFFTKKGFSIDESVAQTILVMVKQLSTARKTAVDEDEILALYFDLTRYLKVKSACKT